MKAGAGFKSRFGSSRQWRRIARHSWMAALFVALAVFGALLLQPHVAHAYIVFLLTAALLCGWMGGRSIGIAAGVTLFIAADYLFLPPARTLAIAGDMRATGLLLAAALVSAGWLSGEWKHNLEKLKESREQFRLLLDGVRDHAVFLLDREGHVATWNAGAQRINGYTASETIGQPNSIFYVAEDVERGRPRELLRIAAAQGTVHTEGWRVRKDGTRFWADIFITALFEENGEVKGYAKITRDVTELHESRAALVNAEQQLRAVVESTPDAVLMINGQGEMIFVNARIRGMFGYAPHELIGKKVEMLVPAEQRKLHVKQREGFLSDPHARPMGAGVSLAARRKDGSEFPVEISLGPVTTSGERNVVASIRDISERVHMERELQNSQLLEMAQLLIRDLEGRIVRWNAGMERVYGYSAREAEGAISHQLLRSSFPGQLETIEAELLRAGFWQGELIHRKKDGGKIVVNSYWVLHRDAAGKPWRILESSTDITAMKEAEARVRRLNQELEKQNTDLSLAKAVIEAQTQKIAVTAKMSALGEMAGGMAHEINNPMGIIHARASDLLELAEESETVPSRTVIETMEKIRKTAARVSKITLGLRKFARETRNDPLVDAAVAEIVEDTLSFCMQRLRQNMVELRLPPIAETLRMACKPTEISQVLLNLLNNAVDAVQSLPEKWVELAVREDGDDLEIAVTDSGNGIPEKLRARLGQPFFTTKEVGQGTGLGLSISRGIVEAHDGTLQLDSECAHTRFVVRLPKSARAGKEAMQKKQIISIAS